MYATMEADIKHGHVVPSEPEKLPDEGRALLVILSQNGPRRQWEKVRRGLGWLKPSIDPAVWQRQLREEWA